MKVGDILVSTMLSEDNESKWSSSVVGKFQQAADTLDSFVEQCGTITQQYSFEDDTHMDESLGLKRGTSWVEGDCTFGVTRNVNQLPKELRQAVARIKYNMSILSASKMDKLFRLYLLTLLVDMQRKEGLAVVIPSGTKVTTIKPDRYRRLQMGLGSLTPS